MSSENMFTNVESAAKAFRVEGILQSKEVYGNGHINDTYLLVYTLMSGEKKRFILQKINTSIFRKPEELMENIQQITSYLGKCIEEEGGDSEQGTLHVIRTKDGKNYYQDQSGACWRMYNFIEDAVCYDRVRTPEDFYESAVAIGNFQSRLSKFPAEKLHETIPEFHNTKVRFEKFCDVVKEDPMGRASEVKEEIQFVLERRDLAEVLENMQSTGELPLRVTHNDTKLNNIMLDKETGKAVCVIDLDTVMPGLAVNDFGDSIRFGASTASEDETDLSKVSCSMKLYEAYVKGFVEGCGGRLTQNEMKSLPLGAKVMTFECGMRFLTDYLEGDIYFRTHREKQNLDRCRTQFKLVEDMEQKWDIMNQIIDKYLK